MRARLNLLRRNRRLLALFALMVVLPVLVFTVLLARAVRSERVRRDYEKTQRQRQIVTLVEADLQHWLFSSGSNGGRSRALVRFTINGDAIVFPDFHLTFPAEAPLRQRPFETPAAHPPLTADAVATQYYPRIQAFLRDQRTGRQGGAQHFLRLRALVVRPADAGDGYVVDIAPVVQYLTGRLAYFCANEPFSAAVRIAAAPGGAAAAGDSYTLTGFPFFEIAFADAPAVPFTSAREYGFIATMTALVSVALLGSLFVYRAVRHESRLSELRNDFVAAVSHEFRSPLSSILMLAERLAGDRPLDADTARQYHTILRNDAERLSHLVSRLLDFAHIEGGRRQYARERMDLAAAAGVPSPRPLWIDADPAAVGIAIQNLLDNAIKYSPPGAPVDVSCTSNERFHCVTVSDQGVGVPAADRERIFDKFYRGANVANVQGVGIGLALVRHIMDGHGGIVTVDSEPGRGSRFTLGFPKAAA